MNVSSTDTRRCNDVPTIGLNLYNRFKWSENYWVGQCCSLFTLVLLKRANQAFTTVKYRKNLEKKWGKIAGKSPENKIFISGMSETISLVNLVNKSCQPWNTDIVNKCFAICRTESIFKSENSLRMLCSSSVANPALPPKFTCQPFKPLCLGFLGMCRLCESY